jgi:hypothetical protein
MRPGAWEMVIGRNSDPLALNSRKVLHKLVGTLNYLNKPIQTLRRYHRLRGKIELNAVSDGSTGFRAASKDCGFPLYAGDWGV